MLIPSRDAFAWLCDDTTQNNDPCTAALAASTQPWRLQGFEISYCLSQPVTETCKVQFSSPLLVVVIICNFIKCSTILLVLWKANEPTLVTLGDAIATHLEEPSPNTAEMCLLNKRTVSKGQWKFPGQAQQWDSNRRLWFTAASSRRWAVCTIL